MIYDLIIIGAGPAGITAAIYAARKALKLMVISKNIGGQVTKTSIVENYSGYQEITGEELIKKLEHHLHEFEFDLKETEVESIRKTNRIFEIQTKTEMFQSKALIIATGAKPKYLDIEGEKEFKNKGVSYCTTCDGPLFRGKDVAVIGGGNSALESVLQLANIANKVYLIIRNKDIDGDRVLLDKILKYKNVEIFYNSTVKGIKGDTSVKSLAFDREGKKQNINVQGIFVNIGFVPNSSLAGKIAALNSRGEIMIDPSGATSMPGMFAAGDCTDIPYKQIIIASGAGAIAAISAFKYLTKFQG